MRPSRRPTVLLFDIDGTLVSTGGAGRRSMEHAFTRLYATAAPVQSFSFAGMTDRAIVRAGLRAAGVPDHDDAIDELLALYLAQLAEELPRTAGFRVMPGAADLLAGLAGEPNVAIGLGTGNVRAGAFAKLARGGIDVHFAFGGFGCDAEERTELIRAGARRGAEALGVVLEACRVVVIGDTPRDVAAAKGIGAACVGVGTGGVPPADLRGHGAEWAFDTLEETAVRAILLDGEVA